MEVLKDLDLEHRKDIQISRLSGGQQKRVSIGVELLTKPGLFFLDEPTSGLDPGTETSLMQLMRRLADQGRTIVLITHATKNVMLADKVIFLARGGYLAWFGPPDEALEYFQDYGSDRDRRSGSMEFDQIYAILEEPSKGSPQDWGKRYKSHAAYQKYVIQPLQQKGYKLPPADAGGRQRTTGWRSATSCSTPADQETGFYPGLGDGGTPVLYPVIPKSQDFEPRPNQPVPDAGSRPIGRHAGFRAGDRDEE